MQEKPKNSQFRIPQNAGKGSLLRRNMTTVTSSKAGICKSRVTIAARIDSFIISSRWGICWDGDAEICIRDCAISFSAYGCCPREPSGIHGSS